LSFNPKEFLATLTHKPGVYCMLNNTGTVLYVGKARNLKKRLASYFTQTIQAPKTRALVAQIAKIEVTVTHTENEALILENTLIKSHQPRYNILFRDDKSYPYIYLSDHPFPRLTLRRRNNKQKGRYFGPYPDSRAVHKTLHLLETLFLIRQCEESVFRHRSRPCLQYQIKRCTAPCVGFIDEASYQEDVQHAVLFLQGKNQAVMTTLVEKMNAAKEKLAYEKAAKFRDQIGAIRKIQAHQYVSIDKGNIDIIVAVSQCVQLLTIRDGRQMGSRSFFPQHPQAPQNLLLAFLPQYYLAADIPNEIILNEDIEEMAMLSEVISQQRGQQVHIHSRVRGIRARWVEMALENARTSLAQRQPSQYADRLAALRLALNLESLPQRMECFDISHTQGEATVASCVVFDAEGPRHRDYRRFNIENITPGDDYAAMEQALRRHYSHLETQFPDILFVDGGLGQVKVAESVLSELKLTDIDIIGIAKGRQPGLETLILTDTAIRLPKDSAALLLIQQIRDEAHRFAITAHRRRRAKRRRTSILEEIEGIGPKRRRGLLNHFGGMQGVLRAGVKDLVAVPGIDQQLAQKIYDFLKSV